MMRITRLDTAAGPEWDALVEQCGGHALHLPAVHRAFHEPADLHLLRFQREQEAAACCLAFEQKSRRHRWSLTASRVLTLPTAPAIVEAESAGEIWQALIEHARASGFDRLLAQPAHSPWLPQLESLVRHRTAGIAEFVIDLRGDVEAVLAGMHKAHRKNIRRATRAGLRIEEDSSLRGLLRLRELQMVSAQRAADRSEGFAVQGEDFFARLHEQVYAQGVGHVLLAYRDEEPVAALAWLSAAGRAQTVRSGSSPAGYETRAMYLLHDALIRRCLEQGVTELNIGGVPLEAREASHGQFGLFKFKQGFGGEMRACHGLDIPLKESAG